MPISAGLRTFRGSPYDGVRAPPQAAVSVFCPLWSPGPCFSLKRLQSLPAPADEDKPDERLPGEVDYDLMVFESLAALDRPQVPDDAVVAVTHSSQMAVFEAPHGMRMHWPAIPSILDRPESNSERENQWDQPLPLLLMPCGLGNSSATLTS